MIHPEFARTLADEWIAAWNASRDSVDKVLQGEV